MAGKQGKDLALSMLRVLPRLSLTNIRDNPGSRKPSVRYNQDVTHRYSLSAYKSLNKRIHKIKLILG